MTIQFKHPCFYLCAITYYLTRYLVTLSHTLVCVYFKNNCNQSSKDLTLLSNIFLNRCSVWQYKIWYKLTYIFEAIFPVVLNDLLGHTNFRELQTFKLNLNLLNKQFPYLHTFILIYRFKFGLDIKKEISIWYFLLLKDIPGHKKTEIKFLVDIFYF